MKKKSKGIFSKIAKILGVFVLVAVVLGTHFMNVEAAPPSITLGPIRLTNNYIDQLQMDIKQLTNGQYAFCLDRGLTTPASTTSYYSIFGAAY